MKNKRLFSIFLIFIFSLFLFGCDRKTAEPTETPIDVKEQEFLIDYDYGKLESNKLTLLYDGCIMVNDLSKYGVKDLKAGDVVKITHTGIIKMALSYPGQIILEEEQIISVDVIKAKVVELYARQKPGGGYDILTNDDEYYQIPNYFIFDDEYFSIDNIYNDLKFYGYIPYNSITNEVIGLYAENYDIKRL